MKDRQRNLEAARYNMMLMEHEDLEYDFSTDSLKELVFNFLLDPGKDLECTFKEIVAELFGYPYARLMSQGRLCEAALCQLLIGVDSLVLSNGPFITTRTHQERNGARSQTIICEDAYDFKKHFLYKGDLNLEKLDFLLAKERVSYVSVETCVNAAGGQNVSIENLATCYDLCQKHRVPLMLDACRILQNAISIKSYDVSYAKKNVWEIVKKICSYSDGMTISLAKNFKIPYGAIIAFRDKSLFEKSADFQLLYGDGLSLGQKKRIVSVLHDARNDLSYLYARNECTRYLYEELIGIGFDLIRADAQHCVVLNFSELLTSQLSTKNLLPSLEAYLYLQYGLRGSVHWNELTGNKIMMRFAVPITENVNKTSMNYLISSLQDWRERGSSLLPLRETYVPAGQFGNYLAHFEPV